MTRVMNLGGGGGGPLLQDADAYTDLLVDFIDAVGDYICHDIEPSEFAGALCALRDHAGCDEDDAVVFSDTFNRVIAVCEDAA